MKKSACKLLFVQPRSFHGFPSASSVLDGDRCRLRAGCDARHGGHGPSSDAGELKSGRDPHACTRPDGVECTGFASALEALAQELPGPEASRACPRTDELSPLLPRR